MADRETKLFITPNSHQVLLHTYLTGREASALKSILLSSLKMTMSDMQVFIDEFITRLAEFYAGD